MKLNPFKLDLLTAKAGLSRVELSQRSGLSKATITAVKKCGTCTTKTAFKLAKGLNCNVEEFILKED